MITFKSNTRGARLIISKLDFSTEISNSTSETLNALVCKVNPYLKEPSSIIHWPKATGLNKYLYLKEQLLLCSHKTIDDTN